MAKYTQDEPAFDKLTKMWTAMLYDGSRIYHTDKEFVQKIIDKSIERGLERAKFLKY